MQYLSGVWESLTGQANAKRKRSGTDDEAEALPDRMTTLKLFSGQCPGRLPSSAAYAQPLPEHSLLDGSSSAASESHFRVGSAYCASDARHAQAQHQGWNDQGQHQQFKLPPPPQPESQQPLYSSYTEGSCAIPSSNATMSLRRLQTTQPPPPWILKRLAPTQHISTAHPPTRSVTPHIPSRCTQASKKTQQQICSPQASAFYCQSVLL